MISKIVLAHYPDINKVINTKLSKWYNNAVDSVYDTFNTISVAIYLPAYQEILNFFDNRSTNVSAESFNAKIKAFIDFVKRVNDSTLSFYRVAKNKSLNFIYPPECQCDPKTGLIIGIKNGDFNQCSPLIKTNNFPD